jgi:hypothetical protein
LASLPPTSSRPNAIIAQLKATVLATQQDRAALHNCQ